MTTLGRLKKLDLRTHWPHEARNFTAWLAQPENLELLSDEAGIEIRPIQTEAQVGRFSVDILAEEENTGRKIIIENQLEDTDHSHLGQLITYAAGIDAEYIIWIVRSAREEHKQAIDWLNEHTDDKISFFLVCIELWQIGDSPPAPKFTILCRPNEWAKSVRSDTASHEELTETKTLQLEFWQQLREYAARRFPELKLRSPYPQQWYFLASGRADYSIVLTINSKENSLTCGIYIKDNKELFHVFFAAKEQIERLVGEPMTWQELPGKKASRIKAEKPFDLQTGNREEAFAWLLSTAKKMKDAFARFAEPSP